MTTSSETAPIIPDIPDKEGSCQTTNKGVY